MNEKHKEKKPKELEKIRDKITQGCTRCGFCTFFCPVYQETLNESFVARGKIALMRDVMNGARLLEAGLLEHMDTCLLCRACVENCPTRVETDAMVLAARADGVSQKDLSLFEKFFFRHIVSRRKTFGSVVKAASRVQKILPGSGPSGSIRHLPQIFSGRQKGRQIPSLSKTFFRDLIPETTTPANGIKTIGGVALFAGCGMEYLYPMIGVRMVQFLAGHGVEVHFPKDQSCCGIPVHARGDLATAEKMARQNADAFKKYDTVITGCATCGATLKGYAQRFQSVSGNREIFESFSRSVVDLNQYLIGFLSGSDLHLEARKVYHGKRVTWHDPCHLVRYQGIKEQPRHILKATSHIQYIEMPDADRCCGFGGSFSIYHYDISRKIAQKKVRAIQVSGADLVVTACPGCIAQLNDALIQNGMPQRAVHIIDLFDSGRDGLGDRTV
jgi:glycolate dehydrogenase iron-sulfur subunit